LTISCVVLRKFSGTTPGGTEPESTHIQHLATRHQEECSKHLLQPDE
jgi:hypothetical protein